MCNYFISFVCRKMKQNSHTEMGGNEEEKKKNNNRNRVSFEREQGKLVMWSCLHAVSIF